MRLQSSMIRTIIALIQVKFIFAAPSSSIVNKFTPAENPTIHSYEESIDDSFGSTLPRLVKTQTVKKTDELVLTSDSRQKTTRQIFDDDDHDIDSTSSSSFDGGYQDSGDEPVRPALNLRKKSSTTAGSNEDFAGFPDDFMLGMKPFDFEDKAGSHRSSSSTGFVRFNKNSHRLPSLASSLGGLKPFPPSDRVLSSAFSSGDEHSSEVPKQRTTITPQSFAKNDHHRIYASNEEETQVEDDDYALYKGDEQHEPSYAIKSKHAGLADGENNNDDDNHEDREEGSNHKRSIGEFSGPADEFQLEKIEPPTSDKDPYISILSRRSSSIRSSDDSTSSSSSNVVRGRVAKLTKSDKNDNDHREAEVQLGESQHFMPHFINGPMHRVPLFGGNFRSQETSSHQGGPPPIRHFRQASHRPPFFHLPPNHFYGSDELMGFFPGGGGEFGPGGPALVPTSHFETLPQRFSQPEFRFPGERQRKLPVHRPSPMTQLHENDNHHGASATNNILGSGNFGIIRGGLFADDDNPEPSITPLDGYLSSNDDFFHGFRDFQPFGGNDDGPMHNSLSSKSHNIHRSQSKTAPVVVVLPNSASTTTTTTSSRSRNTTTTPIELEEQIMEEK